MNQFPEGVAFIKFDNDRKYYIDYCNQTIKKLFRIELPVLLLDKIANMKKLTVMKKENSEQNEIGGSFTTYKSLVLDE